MGRSDHPRNSSCTAKDAKDAKENKPFNIWGASPSL